MKIEHLRVKPRKTFERGPCAIEFANMLACWATNKDLTNTDACAARAQALKECMQKPTRGAMQKRSTINFHLARFSKSI